MDPQSPQANLDNNAIDASELLYPGAGLAGPPPPKPFPGVSGDAGGYFSGGSSSIAGYFSAIPSWAWLVLGGLVVYRIVR